MWLWYFIFQENQDSRLDKPSQDKEEIKSLMCT